MLTSLKSQTYPNFRVLISDDASADGTLEICRAFAAGDSRFRILHQPRRRGWIGNINKLLQEAGNEADFLFFMPHDDELDPLYVEKLVGALAGHPGAVMAFCDLNCFEDGRHRETQTYRELEGIKNRTLRAVTWLHQPASGWCVPYRGLFRSDTIRHFKKLRPTPAGAFAADWVWIFYMTLLGEFIRVPEVLYRRNRGPHSLSQSWRHSRWKWIAAVLACGYGAWRSPVTLREKVLLQRAVLHTCVKVLRNGFIW